jgi:hypothetical protein
LAGAEHFTLKGNRSPDRPVRRQTQHRIHFCGSVEKNNSSNNNHNYNIYCAFVTRFLIHPLILSKHLTALDPAGPAFTNDSCVVRLCKGDANFTEAIHTNGHPDIGFGTCNEDGKIMPS